MYQLIINRVRFSLLLHWAFKMAAPVPPGGRGGSPAGGPALLAQMVTAMQAAAAGITSPRPRRSSTTPTQSENICPYFKGLLGERPEAHLLRADDWMDIYNILPANKPANFKHTLDHLASVTH